MDRIESEAIRFCCPGFADVFIGRETLQGFEPTAEVIGSDKISQMGAQLVTCFVVVTVDGGLFEGAVHALDLTVRPGVIGFGQAMLNAVRPADLIERVATKLGSSTITEARQVDELEAVIGEHDLKPVRHRFDQGCQEAHRGRSISLFLQRDEGKL